MKYAARSAAPGRQKTGCAVVGVFQDGELSRGANALGEGAGRLIRHVIKTGDITGRPDEWLMLPNPPGVAADRLLVLGLGPRAEFARKQFRRSVTAAAGRLAKSGTRDALLTLTLEEVPETDARTLARTAVEATEETLYRFDELKSEKGAPTPKLAALTLSFTGRREANAAAEGIEEGQGVAAGVALTRNLANRPANVCTPSHLAAEARRLARRYRGMKAEILNEADMKRLGMNALLAVTAGSAQPAKLIVLHYRGTTRSAPVALVGKGVTFDAGGISLKPPPAMDEMKYDMGGAASVLGTMAVLGELQPAINVVAVVPTCENLPSGTATKPGDIVKTMSGKTVEILNTDAEGRLILCDALTYARRFRPAAVIDVATLTGACVVALGHIHSGLFAPAPELGKALEEAGRRAGDTAWPMPIDKEYADALKSNFADFANVGDRWGGAITAACFLAKFTEGLNWAHLDVAGTAWKSGAEKGATGRPVPLLAEYLLARSRGDAGSA